MRIMISFFVFKRRHTTRSTRTTTLLPYTTLFRSQVVGFCFASAGFHAFAERNRKISDEKGHGILFAARHSLSAQNGLRNADQQLVSRPACDRSSGYSGGICIGADGLVCGQCEDRKRRGRGMSWTVGVAYCGGVLITNKRNNT